MFDAVRMVEAAKPTSGATVSAKAPEAPTAGRVSLVVVDLDPVPEEIAGGAGARLRRVSFFNRLVSLSGKDQSKAGALARRERNE
ncbi:hypothetical protein [Bradyrhizobium sp. AZCC 1699]|uniref:hypothetical protein n=1 Tax=Bradyrhizobium sp. AZCC 1699 TaxID=3117024 RepID=UPI002FEF776E